MTGEPLTFKEALNAVDKMDDDAQKRVLATFRETFSGFEDVRSAFIAAVTNEVTEAMLREILR